MYALAAIGLGLTGGAEILVFRVTCNVVRAAGERATKFSVILEEVEAGAVGFGSRLMRLNPFRSECGSRRDTYGTGADSSAVGTA